MNCDCNEKKSKPMSINEILYGKTQKPKKSSKFLLKTVPDSKTINKLKIKK